MPMALGFSKQRMADLFPTCLPGSSRKPVRIGRANTLGSCEAARELEIENAIIGGQASETRRSTAQRVEERAGDAMSTARGGEAAHQAPLRRAWPYPTSFCADMRCSHFAKNGLPACSADSSPSAMLPCTRIIPVAPIEFVSCVTE